jgi:hypothetical protein
MKKVYPHTAPPSPERTLGDSLTERDGTASGPTVGGRKPYRRPEVTKRRSLSQATLVSGGGTGGSLAGGRI